MHDMMTMFVRGGLAGAIGLVAASSAVAAPAPAPTLLSARQAEVDRSVAALVRDPQIVAARDALVRTWSASPAAQLPDARSQLAGAADELVFATTRAAVERKQFAPTILWWETPPYRHGGQILHGGRFAIDDPDRIYRSVSVDPALRYVIRGQRAAQPSNPDFLFEVTGADLKTLGRLRASEVDVSPDGAFSITVDASAQPARNHLTIAPGANAILIRDTVADWAGQLPNRISIEAVGAPAARPASREAAVAEALTEIRTAGAFVTQLATSASTAQPNRLVAQVRSADQGVEGAIIAINRFSIKDDEALVVTVDGQGAAYVGLQLTDSWGRSMPYWERTSSLSNRQARHDADGAITYIVSPRDPGFYNWLDPSGLHDGIVALRVENFPASLEAAKVVRSIRLVKLADLPAALPKGAVRTTPAERLGQQAERKAGFERRLTQ